MLDERMLSVIREGVQIFVEVHCSERVKGKFIRLFTSTETLPIISAFLTELLPQQHVYPVFTQEGKQSETTKTVEIKELPYFQHRILGAASNSQTNVLDDQGCIDIRNEVEKRSKVAEPLVADSLNFIYLFDGSIEVTGSLGEGTFAQIDFDVVLQQLLTKKLSKVDQNSKLKNLISSADSSGTTAVGILHKILFVQRLFDEGTSIENLGPHLHEIGLIPDLGLDYLERVTQNRVSVREIFAKSSTSAIAERLQRANLVFGEFFQKLRKFLEDQNVDMNPSLWKSKLPDDLTFEKWPIVSKSDIELLDLSIKPFVSGEGKLDRGCFLHYDSDSGTLTANDKVKISWVTTPATVGQLGKWKVEIVPVEEIRADFPTLRTKVIQASSRTATVTFDLSDEEKEDLAPRYQVRLTALDLDANEVYFSKKSSRSSEIASAYSQEFLIDSSFNEPPDRSTTKNNIYSSIGHAMLDKALKGATSTHPNSLSFEGDFLTCTIGNGKKVSIPISPLIIDIQNSVLANPDKVFYFTGASLTGGKISFSTLDRNELGIPVELLKIRERVLSRLNEIDGPKVPDLLFDDLEFAGLCHEYLAAYSNFVSTSTASVKQALLKMDTLQVSVASVKGVIHGSILLALHPLRLKWLADHYVRMSNWSRLVSTELDRRKRPERFDFSLASAVSPANFPFALLGHSIAESRPFVYLGELTFGTGLYVEPSNIEQQFCLEALNSVLSPHKLDVKDFNSTDSVSNKVNRYLDSHAETNALNLISIAPGEGTLVASILGKLMTESSEGRVKRSRVTVYSDYYNFVRPLGNLQDLQELVEQLDGNHSDTFLSPSLQVSAKRVDQLGDDLFDEHIAIIEGIAESSISYAESKSGVATTTLNGLIVRTSSVTEDNNGGKQFLTFPALAPLDRKNPDLLTDTHLKYLKALVSHLGGPSDALPALELEIDVDKLAQLAVVHSFADWVIAVDPHIGLGIIEVILGQALIEGFVLDYAPDFIDGVGNRITVSSSKNAELFKVLEEAMNYIGLLPRGVDARYLLESLSLASGQLALRLLREDTKAKETIGLAVTMAYLRISGHLKNKIVIPVDSHLNLFGTHSRNSGESGERCDLILIEFTNGAYSIDLVEVKARTGEPEAALPLVMESQINQTEAILIDRIFSNNGESRFDSDLQWARWASLLRFYSERAFLRKELDGSLYEEIIESIREVELTHKSPTVNKTGYIVAMNASKASIPRKFGEMELVLLNAEKLRDQGFTTILAVNEHSSESSPVVDATPAQGHDEEGAKISQQSNSTELRPQPAQVNNKSSEARTDQVGKEISILLGVEVENG